MCRLSHCNLWPVKPVFEWEFQPLADANSMFLHLTSLIKFVMNACLIRQRQHSLTKAACLLVLHRVICLPEYSFMHDDQQHCVLFSVALKQVTSYKLFKNFCLFLRNYIRSVMWLYAL